MVQLFCGETPVHKLYRQHNKKAPCAVQLKTGARAFLIYLQPTNSCVIMRLSRGVGRTKRQLTITYYRYERSKLSIHLDSPQFNQTAQKSYDSHTCSFDALGNNASFAVTEHPRGIQQSLKFASLYQNVDTEEYRKIDKIRYRLLYTARGSLKKYATKNHRIAACHYEFAPNSGAPRMAYYSESGSASWRHTKKCDNALCPVCSARVGIETRNRLARIAAAAYAQGKVAVLVTLTIQHDARHSCKDNVDAMKNAWRKFRDDHGTRQLLEKHGVWGYASGMDETFSPVNGVHFHPHVIYFVDGDKFNENDWKLDYDDDSLWSQLAAIWTRMVNKVGRTCIPEVAVNFQVGDQYIVEYIAKHGHEPKDARWDITAEASLKTVKRAPEDHYTLYELMILAHAGDTWAMQMYAEYCDAMHNKNRLRMSQNVLELEKSLPDPDPDPRPDPDMEFVTTYDAFRVARNTRNKRGQWLAWMEQKQFQRIIHDSAHCHVLGVFQYQASILDYQLSDGWQSVIEVSLQGQYDFVESTEIGRVFVRAGKAVEVVVTQPLDSGFYGKFVYREDIDYEQEKQKEQTANAEKETCKPRTSSRKLLCL